MAYSITLSEKLNLDTIYFIAFFKLESLTFFVALEKGAI